MEKVYFDQEPNNSWVVKDLSDFYTFRCINTKTNTEKNIILSWTKDREREQQISDELKSDDIRLYVAELEGVRIYFVLKYDFSKFTINPSTVEDVYEMDKFFTDTGYKFTGTQKI